MICHGEVENQIIFRAAGGVLAGTAAIIPLVVDLDRLENILQ